MPITPRKINNKPRMQMRGGIACDTAPAPPTWLKSRTGERNYARAPHFRRRQMQHRVGGHLSVANVSVSASPVPPVPPYPDYSKAFDKSIASACQPTVMVRGSAACSRIVCANRRKFAATFHSAHIFSLRLLDVKIKKNHNFFCFRVDVLYPWTPSVKSSKP